MAIERFAYRPLRNAPKINILITAIGVSLFLQYMGQVIFGATPQVFPTVLENEVWFSIGELQFKSLDITVLLVTIATMRSGPWLKASPETTHTGRRFDSPRSA